MRLLSTFVLLFCFFGGILYGQQPPSVLLIQTDDQGWGDIRSHGNDLIDTPNVDRITVEGARFNRFFVSPVCAPTRAGTRECPERNWAVQKAGTVELKQGKTRFEVHLKKLAGFMAPEIKGVRIELKP